MTHESWDTVVIGAGHNGLVCAEALARGGERVLVLEAGNQVGGLAARREFAPGFRAALAAHLVHQFPDSLARELKLETHGLTWACRHMATTVTDGVRQITIEGSRVTGVTNREAAAWANLHARLDRFARFLGDVLGRCPPRLGTDRFADRWSLIRTGLRLRLLGKRDMREFLRIAGMNAYDLAADEFEDPLLRAALGMDATLGTNYGPRAPGTVLTLLCRRAGEAGSRGGLSVPVGGAGALSDALKAAAQASGVTVRTQSAVARIAVEGDRVIGVDLENGDRIPARRVVSAVDPRQTFLSLLGTEHLDTGFVRRVDHFRSRGITAKLHLALRGRPETSNLTPTALGHRLWLVRSLDHIEKAFDASKYGEVSSDPVLEVTVPTCHDASLAPADHHVLSAVVNYCAYETRDNLETARQALYERALTALERVMPALRQHIVGAELLTPKDLEQAGRISGGHWHHGELAFDQFLMVRPFPGAAQYDTPVEGLHLCSAGTHPGGGLTGLPGRLAAERILRSRA